MTQIDPSTGEILDYMGRRLNAHGQELPDPTPIAPPIGYTRQKPLHQLIREMVQSEQLRVAAEQSGMETLEEAEDFDVDDDYDPSSPWEENFDPLAGIPAELRDPPPSESPEASPEASPAPTKKATKKPAAPEPEDA